MLTVDLDPTLNAGKGRTVQRLRPNIEFKELKKFSMVSLRVREKWPKTNRAESGGHAT